MDEVIVIVVVAVPVLAMPIIAMPYRAAMPATTAPSINTGDVSATYSASADVATADVTPAYVDAAHVTAAHVPTTEMCSAAGRRPCDRRPYSLRHSLDSSRQGQAADCQQGPSDCGYILFHDCISLGTQRRGPVRRFCCEVNAKEGRKFAMDRQPALKRWCATIGRLNSTPLSCRLLSRLTEVWGQGWPRQPQLF